MICSDSILKKYASEDDRERDDEADAECVSVTTVTSDTESHHDFARWNLRDKDWAEYQGAELRHEPWLSPGAPHFLLTLDTTYTGLSNTPLGNIVEICL